MRVGGDIKKQIPTSSNGKSADNDHMSGNSNMSTLFKDMKVNITTEMYSWVCSRGLLFFIASLSVLFEFNTECINTLFKNKAHSQKF